MADFDYPCAGDSTDLEGGLLQTNQLQDLESIDVMIKSVFNAFNKHNDGIIPFKVVRDHFLTGKQKFPKIEEWRREELESYLEKNYLPGYEE